MFIIRFKLLFLFYVVSSTNNLVEKSKDSNIFRSDTYQASTIENDSLKIESIYFEPGKFRVVEENAVLLDELANKLKRNSIIELLIVGHADDKSDSIYNKELSKKRAQEVMSYLIKAGILKDRMYLEAFGELRRINYCKDRIECPDSVDAINRRVELVLFSD